MEENVGVIIVDLGFGKGVLNMTPKARATKAKIDKLDSIKTKNFCHKMTLSRNWKENLQHGNSLSSVYKELLELKYNKANTPQKIWTKNSNRHFSKDTQIDTNIWKGVECH